MVEDQEEQQLEQHLHVIIILVFFLNLFKIFVLDNRKINENKDKQDSEEKYFQLSTQLRSDTISDGGQQQQRSYAQVMLKRSGGSGFVAGAEEERLKFLI
jgi:hypothetical protein